MTSLDPYVLEFLVGLACFVVVPVMTKLIVCMVGHDAFRRAVEAGAPPGPALEALTRVLIAVVNALSGGGKPPVGPNVLTA